MWSRLGVNDGIYCTFSFLLVIKLTYSSEDIDRTPKTLYIWCAFSYVGAMLASNAALQYVSYPTQVNNIYYMWTIHHVQYNIYRTLPAYLIISSVLMPDDFSHQWEITGGLWFNGFEYFFFASRYSKTCTYCKKLWK